MTALDFGVVSAAGAALIPEIHQLAEALACPFILYGTEGEEYGTTAHDAYNYPATFISDTRARLLAGVIRGEPPAVLARVPHVPLTLEGTRERPKFRFEEEERVALRCLADQGSGSSSLYLNWGLFRGIIQCAIRGLCFSRKLQVTSANVLTFSETAGDLLVDRGRLLPT